MARSKAIAVGTAAGQATALAFSACRGLGRLLWGLLWGLATRIRRNPQLRSLAARLRDRALAVLDWCARLAGRASDALYRRIGRQVTAGLSGIAFAWMMVMPDATPLYRGLDWSSDLDCMAMNIYHEARGEPELGRLAVGHVVMNRVNDPRFPGTVCGVIMQGGAKRTRGCQFSWWCDGRNDRPTDQRSWVDSHQLASRIFAGTTKDPTGGALWYHADYVKPSWRNQLKAGPKIGQHRFYLAPEKR